MVALDAKTEKRWWLWTLKLKMMMALNTETKKKWWLWMPKLRSDDGFECLNWEDGGSELRNREWWWLWTSKLKCKEIMRGSMPQCSMLLQHSIHENCLKETPWVSKDALLASQNGQINYKHSLTTYLTKTRDLMKCHNNSNASDSRCHAGGIHRRIKGMIL